MYFMHFTDEIFSTDEMIIVYFGQSVTNYQFTFCKAKVQYSTTSLIT